MKKNYAAILILLLSFITHGQKLELSFQNPEITSVGTDFFYEVDIMISSDITFSLGSGQFFLDYNPQAFGPQVHNNNNIEYITPSTDTSILNTSLLTGAVVVNFGGNSFNLGNHYRDFTTNDSTNSKTSFIYLQNASGGVIGNNIPAGTPVKLVRVKIKYLNAAVTNLDPMVSFDVTHPFDDQFFTSCGPYDVPSDTTTFIASECPIGTEQIFDTTADSSGSAFSVVSTWSGDVNSSILNTNNWVGNSLPAVTDNVVIPEAAISPIIDSEETLQVNDFTVNGSLTINDGGNLLVDGDFENTNSVIMESSASESSTLLVKGTAIGEVVYRRGGLKGNEFSLVTAPVSGQSIKEFAENPANDIRVNTSVTPNRLAIAFYDESQPAGSKWVYYTTEDIETDALTFEQGRGYAISRNTDGSVTFTGTLETKNVTKNLDIEWNALGNPYTTFLPVNENGSENFITDNASKLNPANLGIYIWDNTQGKFIVLPLSGSENFLAPGQGFFVRAANGATSVSFDELQRVKQPLTEAIFNKESNNLEEDKVGITLIATANGKSVKTTINYTNTATEGLDPGYDLGNFSGAAFDVFTKLLSNIDGENFTIQSLPIQNINAINIPVGLVSEEGANVNFSVENIPSDIKVYLEDKLLNILTPLDESDYNVTIAEAMNGSGRFYLKTQKGKQVLSNKNNNILDIKIYASKEHLFINGIEGTFNLQLYNVIGKEVFKTTEIGDKANKIALLNLQKGIYVAKINTRLGTKSSKIIVE